MPTATIVPVASDGSSTTATPTIGDGFVDPAATSGTGTTATPTIGDGFVAPVASSGTATTSTPDVGSPANIVPVASSGTATTSTPTISTPTFIPSSPPNAAIDAIYQNTGIDSRTNSFQIIVGTPGTGFLIIDGVSDAEWHYELGKTPTARIKIGPDHSTRIFGRIAFRAPVAIMGGFNNLRVPQFIGYVIDVPESEGGISLVCDGASWAMDAHFHDIVYTLSNTPVETAVSDILTQASIANRSIVIDPRTLAVNSEITITFATYGEAVKHLVDPDGGEWWEAPDGTVHVRDLRQLDKWLTSNTTRQYSFMHLRAYSVETRVRDTKNEAFVRGGLYDQLNPDGSTDSVNADGQANAASPYVIAPDGSPVFNDIDFDNEIIDDLVFAGEVAGRIVNFENGLHKYVNLTVDGDPLIALGMNVLIQDGLRPSTIGGVMGYTAHVKGDDWTTEIQMLSIDNTDAASIFPIAIFFHGRGGGGIEFEEGGNGVMGNITLDGSASRDLNGGTLTYLWSDNQGIVTGNTAIVSFPFDPSAIVPPWLVTLQVTNSAAQSDSVTHLIPIDFGGDFFPTEPGGFSDIILPNMLVAQFVSAGLTLDAAQSWTDMIVAEGGISCCLAPPISSANTTYQLIVGIVGTNTGRIYQMVQGALIPVIDITGGISPITGLAYAVGPPIVHVWMDLKDFDVAWALTEDGRVFRSNGLGGPLSWFLWDDLKIVGSAPRPHYRGSRIATPVAGGLWIYGGGPEGPPIAVDPNKDHNWFHPAFGGELQADLGFNIPTIDPPAVLVGIGGSQNPRTAYWQGAAADGVLQAVYPGQPPFIGGFSVRELWCMPDGTTMFCIMSGDIVSTKHGLLFMRSPNGGVMWFPAEPVYRSLGSSLVGILNGGPNPYMSYYTNQSCIYGVNAYCVGSDGTIYAATSLEGVDNGLQFGVIHDGDGDIHPTRIWRSTDGGQRFELLLTLPSQSGGSGGGEYVNWPFSINHMAISADNQTIMAVLGNNHTLSDPLLPNILVTPDGGGSWSLLTSATFHNFSFSGQNSGTLVAADGGRFLWHPGDGGASSTWKPQYNDDAGGSWTDATITITGYSISGYAASHWHGGSIHIIAGRNNSTDDIRFWISTDDGATYTPIGALDGIINFGSFSNLVTSFDYDPANDRLHIALSDGPEAVISNISTAPSVDLRDGGVGAFPPTSGFVSLAVNNTENEHHNSMWTPHFPSAPISAFVREAASKEQNELAIILDTDTHVPAVYYTRDILGDGSAWTRALGAPAKSHGRWIAPDMEVGKFAMGFDDNLVYLGDVDLGTGIMTISEAPLALDAGLEQQFGVWLGAVLGDIAGVYAVAATGPDDGSVWKTFDRFQTTLASIRPSAGGITAPAGMLAYMIAIGIPLPTQSGGDDGSGDPPVPPPDPTPPPPPPPPPPPGATRDVIQWPFSTHSIWNMPIGSGAQYLPANITPEQQVTYDREWFIRPLITDPIVNVYENHNWGGPRCATTFLMYAIHMDPTLVIPGTPLENNCGAILDPVDNRTLKQLNPMTICVAGGDVTCAFTQPNADLYGDGIVGSHTGSDLSSVGGSLRRGELIDGFPIRHAIKLNLWGNHWYSREFNGFRWPATTADSAYLDPTDEGYHGTMPQLRMGSLLAIPPGEYDALVASLNSAPARKLAWALLNYGAYTVDDSSFTTHAFCLEDGAPEEFLATWGWDFAQDGPSASGDGLVWYDDINRIMAKLAVVNNNGPSTIGGGGTPRQPLAPEITPP